MIGTRGQRDVRREDCPGADAHAFGHDAAGAEEGTVLDDHRRRVRRLQHAADADAACEMHVRADWAHEPTVAQVSTIVRGPTQAPILT